MDSGEPALAEELRSERERTEFLGFVKKKYGEELRRICVELLQKLPEGTGCQPFVILTQAKLRVQESQLQDLTAINAAPFSSARDLDRPSVRKKKRGSTPKKG